MEVKVSYLPILLTCLALASCEPLEVSGLDAAIEDAGPDATNDASTLDGDEPALDGGDETTSDVMADSGTDAGTTDFMQDSDSGDSGFSDEADTDADGDASTGECSHLDDFAPCEGGICRQGMCRPDDPKELFSVYQVYNAENGNFDIDYPGYHPQGVLTSLAFFAMPEAGENLAPLYNCLTGNDTFVSVWENCEGQSKISDGPIGWVKTQPAEGLEQIVRCRGNGDHAVGGQISCPHGLHEDPLGYSVTSPDLCGDHKIDFGEYCDGQACCTQDCTMAPDGQTCPLGTCRDFICRQDASSVDSSADPIACLDHLFDGTPGDARELNIPIDFNGRPTIGDLNGDGVPDLVMSSRNRIAAYTVCGHKLWDVEASTNWDFSAHYFWNYTTYGYVGDADGDGQAEFLHIGADWTSLYVRNGANGQIENTISLPAGTTWMYVFLARRADDSGQASTRVVVSGPGYADTFAFASYDLRSGTPGGVGEWFFSAPMGTAKSVYLTPQAANLDGEPGDELFYGTLALSGNKDVIWLFNVGSMSMLSAIHAATVTDIDPNRPGLECVYSIYGPNAGQPSLVTFANQTSNAIWFAYSPSSELHPHEHAVADFIPSSPGLETLARNNNGLDHWMVDSAGQVIRQNWRIYPGWDGSGEYVQAIYWDSNPGAEVLYLERHTGDDGVHAIRSRMVIISVPLERVLTHHLAGGIMEDTRGWTGVSNQAYFNPYEAAGIVADLIGDGREEVLTWGNSKFTIYYNSGNKGVPKRWGNMDYELLKKISNPLYSPR